MKKVIIALLVVALALSCFAGCGPKEPDVKDLGTVRVGVQGNMGSSAAFVAEKEGYWAQENIKAEITVTTGPQLITGIQTDTLDVAFLGNGVAWNYFTENSDMKLLVIDNLTDDDRLIGKASTGIKANASNDEIAAALKGKSVALDLAATPGSFFKSLVTDINEGKDVADKIWFNDLADTFPNEKGLVAGNKINVVNTTNANIYAAMQAADSADFCVAFSPISTQLLEEGFVEVAKTSTHLADKITPSNWAVSTKFLESNPEAVQAFVNALVKGMDLRAKDTKKACEHTYDYLKQDVNYASADIAYWPLAADLAKWAGDGDMLKYVEQIRNSHVNGANLAKETKVKTAAEASDFTFVINATK